MNTDFFFLKLNTFFQDKAFLIYVTVFAKHPLLFFFRSLTNLKVVRHFIYKMTRFNKIKVLHPSALAAERSVLKSVLLVVSIMLKAYKMMKQKKTPKISCLKTEWPMLAK